MAGKLTVIPRPEPKTDVQEMIQRLSRVDAADIVVVYRKPSGGFDMLSNQGDAAGTLYFLDQFRHSMLLKAVEMQRDMTS